MEVIGRSELFRPSSLPKGIKVHTLNPCNCLLNVSLLDGSCARKCSCKCGREGKTHPKILTCENTETEYKLTKLLFSVELAIVSEQCMKTLRTSMFYCRVTDLFSYDTSSLKRTQVVIDGDVESNPGPSSSIEGYRAAIGRYYFKAVSLSQKINMFCCSCEKYENAFYKSSRSNLFTMMKLDFYEEIKCLYPSDDCSSFNDNCRDLRFCITAIESIFDVSFLKSGIFIDFHV